MSGTMKFLVILRLLLSIRTRSTFFLLRKRPFTLVFLQNNFFVKQHLSFRKPVELPKPEEPSTVAIKSNGIEGIIYVENDFNGSSPALLRLVVTNNNPGALENFVFQAAVTKVFSRSNFLCCFWNLYNFHNRCEQLGVKQIYGIDFTWLFTSDFLEGARF